MGGAPTKYAECIEETGCAEGRRSGIAASSVGQSRRSGTPCLTSLAMGTQRSPPRELVSKVSNFQFLRPQGVAVGWENRDPYRAGAAQNAECAAFLHQTRQQSWHLSLFR